MVRELIVTRDITRTECHWLDNDVKAGTKVYEYCGCTYGCVTPNGTAVALNPDQTPFFELPSNSVKAI